MWPTPVAGAPTPPRARTPAVLTMLMLGLAVAVTGWLSIRAAQSSAPVFVNSTGSTGTLWSWDGTGYRVAPGGGGGPRSNDVDMAFDRGAGVTVAWDHGCARLVMGFTGGCLDRVNQTWTWDGASWTAVRAHSSPLADGSGVLIYDGRLGRVVYVNGAGEAWSFTGRDWSALALPGGPSVPRPGSYAASSTFAVGYDERRGSLVFLMSDRTWLWDGTRWSSVAGGVDLADARPDAHIVYDGDSRQLVYVGSRATWTWDGASWTRHDQPDIASGTLSYDAARGRVMLVEQDTGACSRVACQTQTWWLDSSATWVRMPANPPLMLSLTRSGASAPPMAFDESRNVILLLVSGH